jgi:hypothetical protein
MNKMKNDLFVNYSITFFIKSGENLKIFSVMSAYPRQRGTSGFFCFESLEPKL